MPVVSARETPISGLRNMMPSRCITCGIPASASTPPLRNSPISTVSAWSSNVWASNTTAAFSSRAAPHNSPYRASRAAASTPSPCTCTLAVRTATGARPQSRHRSAVKVATRSEPDCKPWSTITAPHRKPRLAQTIRQTADSAIESRPPEQATSTKGASGAAWCSPCRANSGDCIPNPTDSNASRTAPIALRNRAEYAMPHHPPYRYRSAITARPA